MARDHSSRGAVQIQAWLRLAIRKDSVEPAGRALGEPTCTAPHVAEGECRQLEAADVEKARIPRELKAIALVKPLRSMLADGGRILPPSERPEDVHAAVKSYEVVTGNVTDGNSHQDTIVKGIVKLIRPRRSHWRGRAALDQPSCRHAVASRWRRPSRRESHNRTQPGSNSSTSGLPPFTSAPSAPRCVPREHSEAPGRSLSCIRVSWETVGPWTGGPVN